MDEAPSFHTLVTMLTSRLAQQERVALAIDGRGGAGKSSLARKVMAKFPKSVCVEYDSFHLPRAEMTLSRRYDPQRLQWAVLQPFREGKKKAVFKEYNWGYFAGMPDGFKEEPREVEFQPLLIVEGCATLCVELARSFDVCLWLEATPEEAFYRGYTRDTEEYGLDPTIAKVAWEEWAQWEKRVLLNDNRAERADFILQDKEFSTAL